MMLSNRYGTLDDLERAQGLVQQMHKSASVVVSDGSDATLHPLPETSSEFAQETKIETCCNEESSQLTSVSSGEGYLSLLQLTVLIFYEVSGGPFGIEGTVRAGGALYSLLGFAVAPLVWSVPEALMTAELGSAYPEASGGVVWVEEAFGPWAGWTSGFLSWIAGATDNAVYPVLFLKYVWALCGRDMTDTFINSVFVSGISIVLAYVNYLGLPMVGDTAIGICMLSMASVLVFIVIGMPKVDCSNWLQTPSETSWIEDDDGGGGLFPYAGFAGILWRPFLNNLFWNLNSFDSAANFAGEVRNVGTIFPRGLVVTVLLMALCYFVTLLVALGVTGGSQEDWKDGYLLEAAMKVGGRWLGGWFLFAAGISNLGMFQAEMSSDAFQLMGMADRGFLPKIFSTRSPHKSPTYGILAGLLIVLFLSNFSSFDSLLEMLNLCYSFALLFEYAAFIKLRVSKPNLPRPYRIPLGMAGCFIMILPAVIGIGIIILLADTKSILYGFASLALACGLFACRRQKPELYYAAIVDCSDT